MIVTGIPFPNLYDPKVKIKKEYIDARHRVEHEFMTGDQGGNSIFWADFRVISLLKYAQNYSRLVETNMPHGPPCST